MYIQNGVLRVPERVEYLIYEPHSRESKTVPMYNIIT